MSSFHIKWSKQVAIPMGDRWGEDQGGVASCLNWTRGQKTEHRSEPEVPPGTPTLIVKELQLLPGTDRWQAWESPSTDRPQPPISSREKSARDRRVATPVTVARCMNWNYGACAKHATAPQYSSRQERTTRSDLTHPNSARKQQKTIIKFQPNLEGTGTLRHGNDFKVTHRPPSGKPIRPTNDIYRQQTPIPVNEEDVVEAVKTYTRRQQIKPALTTSRNHILNRNYQNQTKPRRSVVFKAASDRDQYDPEEVREVVFVTRPVTSFDMHRSDSAMATYRSTTPVMTERSDQPVIAREIWGTENGDVILRGSSMDPLVTDGKFVKIQRPQTCPANGKKGDHFTKWRGKTTSLVKADQDKWKHGRLSEYLQPTATNYYGETAYHRQQPTQKGNVKIKLACPSSSDMNVNVRVQSAHA